MKRTAMVLSAWLFLTLPQVASADRYREEDAGHPLRVTAYLLHPAGVILDRLIFRPAWYIGQNEPFRTLFGVRRPVGSDGDAPVTNPFLEPYEEE